MACEMSFFQTNAHHPPFCFARLRCNEMLLLALVLVLVLLPLSCSASALDPLPVPGGGCWNWPWSSGMSSSSSSWWSSRSSRQTHATPPANDGRLQVTTALTAARASSSIMVRGFTLQHYLLLTCTSQPVFRRCSDDVRRLFLLLVLLPLCTIQVLPFTSSAAAG